MGEVEFKVGDRVRMEPMWKYSNAVGGVIKITDFYVVVKWDDVNGEWHYTHDQAKKLQHLSQASL